MLTFEINQKLKNDILGRIPEGYSNLEKAIFIYYELCKKLNYSVDYYIGKNKVVDYFTDIYSLAKIDGETNCDVVCYTFNAIFAKLLHEANVCDVSPLERIVATSNGKFSTGHDYLVLKIDGDTFTVDATLGVFDSNDLVLSKYSTHTLIGWRPFCGNNGKTYDNLKSKIAQAVKKVQLENQTLDTRITKYLRDKIIDESYLNFSLDDRVKMFINALSFCPDYTMHSFNYLIKLKRAFFSPEEFGHNAQQKQNIDLVFATNKMCNAFEAFLFYNPKGYIPDPGYENFDALKIWNISIKNKTFKSLTIDELNAMVNNHTATAKGNFSDAFFKLTKHGRADIEPIYDKDFETIGYKRTFLIDGHTEDLSVEEGEKLVNTEVVLGRLYRPRGF